MKIKCNSDQEVVDTIRESLKRTSGYCPCRVERTEKNAGTLKVGKINVDEQMELAMRFQVSSIPMLVVFKDGKVVTKSVGYRPNCRRVFQPLLYDAFRRFFVQKG